MYVCMHGCMYYTLLWTTYSAFLKWMSKTWGCNLPLSAIILFLWKLFVCFRLGSVRVWAVGWSSRRWLGRVPGWSWLGHSCRPVEQGYRASSVSKEHFSYVSHYSVRIRCITKSRSYSTVHYLHVYSLTYGYMSTICSGFRIIIYVTCIVKYFYYIALHCILIILYLITYLQHTLHGY